MISKYINIGIGILIVALSISSYYLYNKTINLNNEVSILMSNQKAFIEENSILKNDNRVFKFTIDQLEYYNDSILEEMNNVRKELKIKDKDLNNLQYLLSEAQRKDTIIFKDTLFINEGLDIDTIIGDKWYQMKLGLKYPSTITTYPKFISEKYIVTSYRKETIDPPKKCWLLRLFQKKHNILEVEVVEKCPYVENKKQRFVEIIK